MNGWRALDLIFPYIEKLTPAEQAVEDRALRETSPPSRLPTTP